MATRALRQLTFGQAKSAGRNSAGRITIFHRGGGAKRLQRIIDLKRSTSAMGVVERIEYDPNRSSRIALVRWTQGVEQPTPRRLRTKEKFVPPPELLETSATTIRGQFSFCSLPGMVDRSSQPSFSTPAKADHVMIGLPTKNPVYTKGPNATATSKLASAKDVFFSAFSSPIAAAKGGSGSFSRLPRMAVAGARPPFFATRMGEGGDEKTKFSLNEIQKWKPESIVWAHRIKRKAALPW